MPVSQRSPRRHANRRAYNIKQGQLRPTHLIVIGALLLAPVWALGLEFYTSFSLAEQVRGLALSAPAER